MTGLHLSGKVTLKVDVALRDEINAWLRAQGKNPDAIRKAVLLARHGENTDEYGEPLCFDVHCHGVYTVRAGGSSSLPMIARTLTSKE